MARTFRFKGLWSSTIEWAKGRGGDKVGSSNGRALLIESEVAVIKQRLRENITCAELAHDFNVSWTLIKLIKEGRNWSHVQ